MKVLYISNIPVPYRVRFFNELAGYCDLTVLYERRLSANRDKTWALSENSKYREIYLTGGVNLGNENYFSLEILKIVNDSWDAIIVGCYNSKVQMLAIAAMRLRGIPYVINVDGEPFIGHGVKDWMKRLVLHGASKYLVAGVMSADSLKTALGHNAIVCPYYFSSLTNSEIERNSHANVSRGEYVLVVGQYFAYKGLDVAFRAACLDKSVRYKFVGMGKRSELFCQEMGGGIPDNVEVIPFLQKAELEEEYKKCALLLLPSRQECWGLVVNEAASFGTPIVSTLGSGAAVEFLSWKYPQYLAKPGDADSLYECMKKCLESDNTSYSEYLRMKSKEYSIEMSAQKHLEAIELW